MDLIPHLFAFGFGYPLLLGWLGAAAAPILLHLWNKRKYREVSWAAIEYLLAALKKNSRRMRLEQWILLAVRTLLILLIVFAAAKPFLENAGLTFASGERTLKVLVIDGSYSMAYRPTDKSRFEWAKQWATQIVEESPQGDGFTLVLMASPPVVIVGQPAMEPKDFLEEIENLKLPHGGGDLPATLIKVEEILKGATDSGLSRREVYFLTDLGRNSWVPDLGSDEAAVEYRHRIEQLAQSASLVIVDLGQPGSENVAITSLKTDETFLTVGREVAMAAQVRNFGAQRHDHHLVEFFVDGRRAKETHVDLPVGEQRAVPFNYRFETPGDHVVEARLGSDLLDVDNHRWLALSVKPYLRVLCVDGKPGGGDLSGATDYVVLALNPDAGENNKGSAVQPEVIPESALLERDLNAYDCVFLCNVGQFTMSEARVLDAYLKRGGGLVFFLGDQVLPDRYNRELGGEQGIRVLPAKLKEVVPEAQYRLDPLDYRHPLVSAFKGRDEAGLLSTRIQKYFRLVPTPKSKARVALAFEGGDPAIVEEPIHRGRSILFATEGSLSSTVSPLSKTPWTSLPAWPSFVPLVQEALALAVSGQASDRNVLVGQSIGDAVEPSARAAPVTLVTPDGTHEELRPTSDAGESRWSFADTNRSGVYTAEFGPPAARAESFAVNVETSESDLTRVDPEDLPKQFTTYKHPDLDTPDIASVGRHSALHRELLYGVLALLFLESFLAWRFGHQTT